MSAIIKIDGKEFGDEKNILDFSMRFDDEGFINILCNGIIIAFIAIDSGELILINIYKYSEIEKDLIKKLPTMLNQEGDTVWYISET